MGNSFVITGTTGFLGKEILKKLKQNFNIFPICRNDFDFKISTTLNLSINANLIIHAAGLAHKIPRNESESQEFYDINFHGTERFLNAIKNTGKIPKSFVFISTVAVYGLNSGIKIDENAPLNAQDPYGNSKILAEKAVTDWCKKNGVICTILRLPLLVGVNPKGNLAGMINGVKWGYYFNVGGGLAHKSMVLTEDVATFIPKIAKIGGLYNLSDGYDPTLFEFSCKISKILKRPIPPNMPLEIAKILSFLGDLIGEKFPINTKSLNKIITSLTFDDSRARGTGFWNPKSVIENLEIK